MLREDALFMAACSLRCLQWEVLKEQPESCSHVLTTAVICIQVCPTWATQKKHLWWLPSQFVRLCFCFKVCFTTIPPCWGTEMRRDHLVRGIWSGLTERNGRVCQTLSTTTKIEKKRGWNLLKPLIGVSTKVENILIQHWVFNVYMVIQ